MNNTIVRVYIYIQRKEEERSTQVKSREVVRGIRKVTNGKDGDSRRNLLVQARKEQSMCHLTFCRARSRALIGWKAASVTCLGFICKRLSVL
jgi:endo-1,4-beta-D-glucanase Y